MTHRPPDQGPELTTNAPTNTTTTTGPARVMVCRWRAHRVTVVVVVVVVVLVVVVCVVVVCWDRGGSRGLSPRGRRG